jgi:hypothetical protein
VSSAIPIGNENNNMTIHKQTRTHSLCPEKNAGYLKGKKKKRKKEVNRKLEKTRSKERRKKWNHMKCSKKKRDAGTEDDDDRRNKKMRRKEKGKNDMQENAGSDAPKGLKKKQPPILSCSFFDVFLMFLLLVLFPTHTHLIPDQFGPAGEG